MGRPNLYEDPATEPNIGAIEEMIASGRNINVTLIFARPAQGRDGGVYPRRRRLVGAAIPTVHCRELLSFARRYRSGQAPDVWRGDEGRLAIANAKLAYQNYSRSFSGPRWEALARR
jgi:transaldolase